MTSYRRSSTFTIDAGQRNLAVRCAGVTSRGPYQQMAESAGPVDGKAKQGAGFRHTKVLGYHPILATRADSGEVLHARMRRGQANTQRGARRFLDELIARVRRAGATGPLTVRVDAGFWSNDTVTTLNRLDVRYTMAVRCGVKTIAAAIATIDEDAWIDIAYPEGGQAQVADTTYTTDSGRRRTTRRLVVRRTRRTDSAQQRLWPDWRHHAFITDSDGDTVDVDAFHRHHAVVEWPSATSKMAPGSTTSHRATSTPTRHGCDAPCSPTT